MTSTHAAALTSARDCFSVLRETLADLPDAAMDYTPVAGTSSFAILAAHAITSTRFLLSNGSGNVGSFATYRAGERAASFQAAGLPTATVVASLDAFLPELEAILAKGTQEHLDTFYTFPEDPSVNRIGASFLVHGCAHLREHVGQAELMRDLWKASQK